MLSLGFFSQSNSGWMEDFVVIWVGLVMHCVADRLTSVMDGVTSQARAMHARAQTEHNNSHVSLNTAGGHELSSLASNHQNDGGQGRAKRTNVDVARPGLLQPGGGGVRR